jgi:hypothetical protein
MIMNLGMPYLQMISSLKNLVAGFAPWFGTALASFHLE